MHPRSVDYTLIDHSGLCLVKAIRGTLYFDKPVVLGEGEEEYELVQNPYQESFAEQQLEIEEDEELVDDILAKYNHLPPAQKERLKKLVERERD